MYKVIAALFLASLAFGQYIPPGGGGSGSGSVTSFTVAGTSRQITVTGTCTVTTVGTCTLSLPADLLLPLSTAFTAGTTSGPSLNIPSGVAPTSPASGDFWNLSGIVQYYNGAATRSLIPFTAATCTSGGIPYASSTTGLGCSAAWTVNTLMKGGGAGSTPIVSGITVDSSDNLSTPGTASFGVGSGNAGAAVFTQGTAPGLGTTAVTLHAPASVTSYRVIFPSAAATGFRLWTNSSSVVTESIVASNGSGNVLLSAGTAAIASGKTMTVSNTLTLTGTDSSSAAFGAGGTVTYTIASGAKALATTGISSAACSSAQTDTATGTATTDAIIATFNGDPTAVTGYIPLTAGMLTIIAYPTANTVNFKVCNNTASLITPGAITLNWRVVR